MRITTLQPILMVLVICASFYACNNKSTEVDTTSVKSDPNPEEIHFTSTDYETIIFEASDGLDVYANKYEIDKTSPIIVLCHQARFNKFEYEGTAQRLNDMGFNCLAIDQRSGGPISNQQNETNNLAVDQGLGIEYLDAIPDIRAAIDYAVTEYQQDVILWGSSYSATLALWEGLKNSKVRAVVSFSPGDYFPELGSLTDSLTSLKKPFFITAADFEIESEGGLNDLLSKTTLDENQIVFKPDANGHHGSRALWVNQAGGEQYWNALTDFLNILK
jgi:dienelactone hydrolase